MLNCNVVKRLTKGLVYHFLHRDEFLCPFNRAFGSKNAPSNSEWYRFSRLVYVYFVKDFHGVGSTSLLTFLEKIYVL